MPHKNVFVIGLDDFNREKLESLPQAQEVEFHAALEMSEIRNVEGYDINKLIYQAIERMEGTRGEPVGIISFYDFPGTILVPILADHFGLPGPSFESVIKCENKYWSRLEQQKVIPEHIPYFQAFDPFDDNAYHTLGLLPPFWVKPIKSFRSMLAFQINDVRQFDKVMAICRERVGIIDEPFKELMQQYDIIDEIATMPQSFIAESMIGGWQCTLEGYVHNSSVRVYGVVDSIRAQNSSSFSHYQYPTKLPLEVQHRMIDVTRLAIQQIGLNNTTFNVEFFYDPTTDQVWLLEINPRLSQSHADLFEKVHNLPHFSILVDLALGRKPKPLELDGDFNIAAKFFVRSFTSGTVTRIPQPEAVERLLKRQPSTHIHILVEPGQELSELDGQDMYSYELANVYIGGRDEADLIDKFETALITLQFDIESGVIQ